MAVDAADAAPELWAATVEAAIEEREPLAEQALRESGVPGMAVAIVFRDDVVFSKGFGVKDLASGAPIDADTVFQVASLSKPIASTVVAVLAGRDIIEWDEPLSRRDAEFALADRYVTENVTFADLFSHCSGLPDHAGDLLEDLGFDRDETLERLELQELDPFRSTYQYTNFGLTAAAAAATDVAGSTWEDASRELLYEPLGMTSTSSTYADYIESTNRAVPHRTMAGI
jgi:CubicO group peptidase (beta-lactamase class C family)